MANKQIPQEVFERFAALYWGQKIIEHPLCASPVPVHGKYLNSAVKLELKDLADITDEHAYEVFRIFLGHIPEGVTSWIKKSPSGRFFKQFYVPSILEMGNYSVLANFCDDGTIHALQSNRDIDYWHAADFLRSKGYLIPFMGYSAQDWIDSGRVKIKKP